jgi:PAS domain S-box-containing protein
MLEGLGADVARALTDLNVVAYALNRDGIIVWQNEASRRFIGDVRGSHFTDFVAPEDRRRAQEAFASKVFGNVPATNFKLRAVHPSGDQVPVDVSSVPLVHDGRVVGVLGMLAAPPAAPQPPSERRLTPRQHDVLRLLARGYTTVQIAEELHIAVETVRNHIRGLLAELGVHSRVEAVAVARAEGLVDD